MALPQHKTCLSILRSILGPGAGGEARFAEKIGRSTSWLKKASCGQIALTRDAALAIAYETGVSLNWLLNNDTSKAPVGDLGMPYTLETYALHCPQELGTEDRLEIAFDRLLAIYRETEKRELFVLHFEAFADELAHKFKKITK